MSESCGLGGVRWRLLGWRFRHLLNTDSYMIVLGRNLISQLSAGVVSNGNNGEYGISMIWFPAFWENSNFILFPRCNFVEGGLGKLDVGLFLCSRKTQNEGSSLGVCLSPALEGKGNRDSTGFKQIQAQQLQVQDNVDNIILDRTVKRWLLIIVDKH